ncbi:flagellin [Salinibacter ruber]|uniref:flagellin N-terminal helical domain-containing protein n=1 Tax=Salinibacter ruber TaxID=146919 RepID=UPI0021671CFA|nr:flagellin [Salinibacter ruber]MCS3627527.1 flagellin [Salinibacter ruber]MCS3827613.1 flagellin [Salinibacter ruber]MCS4144435.1 flagellin [Salinibacter ruber]
MSTFSQINTNIQAQRAFQNLSDTSEELQSRQERLTTGLRINSASDDAAGFEIASQLEAKTGAQQQALRNIGDAKSTLSTAEGALDSQLSILQSAQEKATQAANGSLSQSEREAIGTELNALTQEIDDIAKNATFNGDQLLTSSSGSSVDLTFQTGAEQDTTFDVGIANSTAEDLGIEKNLDPTAAEGQTIKNGDLSSAPASSVSVDSADVAGSGSDGELDTVEGGTYEVTLTEDSNTSDSKVDVSVTGLDGQSNVAPDQSGVDLSGGTINIANSTDGNNGIRLTSSDLNDVSSDSALSSNGDSASFEITVEDGDNIGTRIASGDGDQARKEIGKIENAIDTVTSQLSDLGASQNRLSFKESNLETTRTNLSAAQSRIEDADLAKEQTRVAKLQVQQQSGTAQLAQANAAGQSVLSLLGG